MGTRAPLVWEDAYTGEARLETGLLLDTPAWLVWLDDPATASFSYPVYNPAQGYVEGYMTVRKERRQRGHVYWTAYWRVGGRLRKVYLGPATAVTSARLRAVSVAWLTRMSPATNSRAAG
jgi:LuxR family transcriptional regulator, maltose regulon positive regulatory protein